MTDIVDRLRKRDAYLSLDEAADEIEHLRSRLAEAEALLRDLQRPHGACRRGSCTRCDAEAKARELYREPDAVDGERRPCTCPDGERPIPCPRKFAVSECQAAAGWTGHALSRPQAARPGVHMKRNWFFIGAAIALALFAYFVLPTLRLPI